MRSIPSLRVSPSVAFEIVPMLARLTMTLSRPRKDDQPAFFFQHFSFVQAIGVVLFSCSCSQFVSQAPQHPGFSDSSF